MNFWEKLTREKSINEVNKNFKTLEADGWCSNGKTLSGPPALEIQMKLHIGELDIFDDVPFLVKIKRNPEKDPEYLAYCFSDPSNIANIHQWLPGTDVEETRIKKIINTTAEEKTSSPNIQEGGRRDKTAAA